MSLTSVWAKWEKWNSAFRTLFPHVKFCAPHGDQLKWYLGKGSLRMSAVAPRQNTLGLCERAGTHRNCELDDGRSLLAARVRLNAVTQWHRRWEYPWMEHGETAGTAGNENMKGVGIVWVGTRDVYASDVGHMTHEDPWSLNPLPNHHKPPAKNWAQVNHEFDWICRIDWARTNQIIRLCVDRTGMFFCRVTIFSTTWPKGHRWSQSRHLFDVSSVHIVFWGWIILSPRCCLHICSAQGMKYKAWHRE